MILMGEIKEILDNHERRISRLEKASKEKLAREIVRKKTKVKYVGLPGEIIELRDEDFFKNPRTAEEVQQAVKDKGFHHVIDPVKMALLRLVRRKELRRFKEERDKEKTFVYVYP